MSSGSLGRSIRGSFKGAARRMLLAAMRRACMRDVTKVLGLARSSMMSRRVRRARSLACASSSLKSATTDSEGVDMFRFPLCDACMRRQERAVKGSVRGAADICKGKCGEVANIARGDGAGHRFV